MMQTSVISGLSLVPKTSHAMRPFAILGDESNLEMYIAIYQCILLDYT